MSYVGRGTEPRPPEDTCLKLQMQMAGSRRTHSSILLLIADTAGRNPIDADVSVSTAVDATTVCTSAMPAFGSNYSHLQIQILAIGGRGVGG